MIVSEFHVSTSTHVDTVTNFQNIKQNRTEYYIENEKSQ